MSDEQRDCDRSATTPEPIILTPDQECLLLLAVEYRIGDLASRVSVYSDSDSESLLSEYNDLHKVIGDAIEIQVKTYGLKVVRRSADNAQN